ncbi:MAG: hypothetical protein KatS3mg098_161 [Candidatus Parcubacteria bacterium]|nr:preprotein translocase subunit SecG [Patescibacteria group bacterium]BCX15932.1 MAG: hypothetical protein KatS3mg098_161 [Candidatus Parcubacteria bacterium]
MKNIISIAQLVISLILIVLVLLQERGGGISETFGGQEGGFSTRKRGLEKWIYLATLFFLFLFAAVSLANLLIS